MFQEIEGFLLFFVYQSLQYFFTFFQLCCVLFAFSRIALIPEFSLYKFFLFIIDSNFLVPMKIPISLLIKSLFFP